MKYMPKNQSSSLIILLINYVSFFSLFTVSLVSPNLCVKILYSNSPLFQQPAIPIACYSKSPMFR